MQAAARIAVARSSGLTRFALWSFSALLGFVLSVAVYDFVASLLASNQMLGTVALILTAFAILSACLLALREAMTFARLSRLDHLRALSPGHQHLPTAVRGAPDAQAAAVHVGTLPNGIDGREPVLHVLLAVHHAAGLPTTLAETSVIKPNHGKARLHEALGERRQAPMLQAAKAMGHQDDGRLLAISVRRGQPELGVAGGLLAREGGVYHLVRGRRLGMRQGGDDTHGCQCDKAEQDGTNNC